MKKHGKRAILFTFLFVTIICGGILAVCLTRPKASCMAYITTSYNGWGIDGQFLGSGSFQQEFHVKKGDCFYELHDGVWELNPRRNMFYEKIVEITEVGEDGVTAVIYSKGAVSMPYDKSKEVESTFTVDDGINYYHELYFSDYVVK